ncbi:hypothetical protein AFB00_18040 [Pseudonocardia sp. HH130630-07]|nr:hypothetical protein AFB00_18040 [Pseudonocardia sp. HH130630-07]
MLDRAVRYFPDDRGRGAGPSVLIRHPFHLSDDDGQSIAALRWSELAGLRRVALEAGTSVPDLVGGGSISSFENGFEVAGRTILPPEQGRIPEPIRAVLADLLASHVRGRPVVAAFWHGWSDLRRWRPSVPQWRTETRDYLCLVGPGDRIPVIDGGGPGLLTPSVLGDEQGTVVVANDIDCWTTQVFGSDAVRRVVRGDRRLETVDLPGATAGR